MEISPPEAGGAPLARSSSFSIWLASEHEHEGRERRTTWSAALAPPASGGLMSFDAPGQTLPTAPKVHDTH
jgi:hypothetical protein